MLVGSRLEVDFGLDDVIERLFVTLRFGTCFIGVKYIVRTRSHFGDHFARRAQALERFYFSHGVMFDYRV